MAKRNKGIPGARALDNRLEGPKVREPDTGPISVEMLAILLRAAKRHGIVPNKKGASRRKVLLARDALQSVLANVWWARQDFGKDKTDEEILDALLDLEIELGISTKALGVLLTKDVLSGGLDREERDRWKAMRARDKELGALKPPPIMGDWMPEDRDLERPDFNPRRDDLVDRIQVIDQEVSLNKAKGSVMVHQMGKKGFLWANDLMAIFVPGKWPFWRPVKTLKKVLCRMLREMSTVRKSQELITHYKARVFSGEKSPIQLDIPMKELLSSWVLGANLNRDEWVLNPEECAAWELGRELARCPSFVGCELSPDAPKEDHIRDKLNSWANWRKVQLTPYNGMSRMRFTRKGVSKAQLDEDKEWINELIQRVDRPGLKDWAKRVNKEPFTSWVEQVNMFMLAELNRLGSLRIKFWGKLADSWRPVLQKKLKVGPPRVRNGVQGNRVVSSRWYEGLARKEVEKYLKQQ